jgi:hypothetical protein
MMAGRGFVQRQRLHAELRLRFEIVGVDVEDARALAVGGGRLIEAAGRGLRAEWLHCAHFVIRFRKNGEQLRQPCVDVLLQIPIALHQRCFVVVIEARILLQEFEERRQIALEADLLLHLFHLAANARDLFQAELVDGVRRQIGRGREPGQIRIPIATVRHVRPADLRARALEVFVADEVVQPLVGRIDLLRDRVAICSLQARAIGRRDGIRKLLERCVKQALLRVGDDQCLELRQHLLHQHARIRQVLRKTLAHVHDRLIRPHDVIAHARQETLIVGCRRERLRARAGAQHRHQRRQALELIDRRELAGKLRAVDRSAQVEHEDFDAQAIGVRQLLRGELLRISERLAVDVEGDGNVFWRDVVRQLVVVTMVADERREQRVELQLALEVVVEETMQRRRIGVRRECRRGAQTSRQRDGCKESMSSQHGLVLLVERRGRQFRRHAGQKKAPTLANSGRASSIPRREP